ncbi:Predicted arabinose efflux permease, MFS family [Marininema mesophilum]|uniref:Predicted arabinose efflux permease, MFS family n=1 Tax=Marininema mesophilum TaxID=1048340 RepID=A0A1H2ZZT7_9BACL|nr:MFS transporter [Marininema mesophilum]SDX22169.1 Predicted arabinose efflux permease, MFS family [Marininema mesophilum]
MHVLTKMKTGMSNGPFQPLTHLPFRRLFTSQIFSDLSNWLDLIAIGTLITYQWGLGAEAQAAFAFMTGIPWIVVGPLLAIWVDRWNKKHVMLACCLLRIPLIIGFILAPNIVILLVFVFLKEVLDVIFDPARQSAIKSIVSMDQLQEANTLSQLSVHTSKIVAPALGGFIAAKYSPDMVFIAEVIALLLASLFLFRLPLGEEPVSESASKGKKGFSMSEWTVGIHFIFSNRVLLFSVSMMTMAMYILWMYDRLIILWAKELDLSVGDYGVLLAAIALGGVIGAFLVSPLSKIFSNPLNMMTIAGMVGGGALLVIGIGGLAWFTAPFLVWWLVWFGIGLLGPFTAIPYATLLQAESPSNTIGRTVATVNALQNSAMLASPFVGAYLAVKIGIGSVFVIAGVTFFTVCAIGTWLVKSLNLIPVTMRIEEDKVS